jgi:glycosyltransferase involved in cell wall biosynthesis
MTTVSVVVPTRNRSELLAATLRSVLWQRDVDLEVIVVDEASTDDTPAMLAALEDPRVRIVRHETPRGVSAARNIGAANALGEWVAFLDDDDLWAPARLVSQLHALTDTGRHWGYTGSVTITDDDQIVGSQRPLSPERIVEALWRYNAIPGGGSNVIVRRAILMQAGPFDARLRNTEDWEMWIRLAKIGTPAWVCSPLMAYRVHSSSASLDVAEIVRGARLIEELHGTKADWGKLHRWAAESCLRGRYRRAALTQFTRAALRGDAKNVARDLGIIARRRINRDLLGRAPEQTGDSAWMQEAACWLRELEKR